MNIEDNLPPRLLTVDMLREKEACDGGIFRFRKLNGGATSMWIDTNAIAKMGNGTLHISDLRWTTINLLHGTRHDEGAFRLGCRLSLSREYEEACRIWAAIFCVYYCLEGKSNG